MPSIFCWTQKIYASHIYLYNYSQVTNELAVWNTVLLDKLEKNFPSFYGNWNFITIFTGAYHLYLSWAR